MPLPGSVSLYHCICLFASLPLVSALRSAFHRLFTSLPVPLQLFFFFGSGLIVSGPVSIIGGTGVRIITHRTGAFGPEEGTYNVQAPIVLASPTLLCHDGGSTAFNATGNERTKQYFCKPAHRRAYLLNR